MGESEKGNVWQDGSELVIKGAGRDELLLVFLARVMKVDFRVLLYLWERYREDLFFFFFLFSGMKVRFPGFRKFYVALKNIDRLLQGGEVKGWRYLRMVENEVKQVRERGELRLDMRDRTLFRFRGVEDVDEEE